MSCSFAGSCPWVAARARSLPGHGLSGLQVLSGHVTGSGVAADLCRGCRWVASTRGLQGLQGDDLLQHGSRGATALTPEHLVPLLHWPRYPQGGSTCFSLHSVFYPVKKYVISEVPPVSLAAGAKGKHPASSPRGHLCSPPPTKTFPQQPVITLHHVGFTSRS